MTPEEEFMIRRRIEKGDLVLAGRDRRNLAAALDDTRLELTKAQEALTKSEDQFRMAVTINKQLREQRDDALVRLAKEKSA